MNAGGVRALALAAAIVVVWIVLWRNAGASLREWQQGSGGGKTAHEIIPADVVAGIDSALARSVKVTSVRYAAGASSPFRIAGEQPQASTVRQASAPEGRKRLVLRGFLIKDRPLAILESSDGATHILGVGEEIAGQKVAQIGTERVVVKDAWGMYELTVRE